ncbi:hypothetical protein HCN44_007730 [Aphidius gifuensis]|uniref:Inorganic phosphate cotransporter n=1 Tax=Aphidius gifuensis TaxID=684658 RepID=A0A834XPQ1_APHGI|nr:hypothetical protein HCN44_007730 [Aphidius gifuensis]
METIDQAIVHDDAPLCVNDSFEKINLKRIPSDTSSCIKSRYTFGFLGFLGFALVYAMRVNLSVAIVSMVNQTAYPDNDNNSATDVCPKVGPINGTFIPSPGESNHESTQGIILILGYVLTNIPGGRMAEFSWWKTNFGLGTFVIFRICFPPYSHFFLIPKFQNTVPAMHTILAKWVPPLERNKFAAFVYSGANFGTVISLPVSGWLCSLTLWGGWPLAFYLFGSLGMVWYIFWLLYVYDTPAEHPKIDPQEKLYIEALVEPKHDNNSSVAWYHILTSGQMWVIIITQCGQSWAFYTLLTELPTYMDRILHFGVQQDAFLSTLPYLTAWIMGLVISSFADSLLERRLLTPLTSMKFWNTIGSLGPSLSFLGAIWAGCDRVWVMIMLSGLGSLQGAIYSGNQMNHIVLAPRYAGTLYGFSNACANACGFRPICSWFTHQRTC